MIEIIASSVMTQEGHFVQGQKPNCSEALQSHLIEIGAAIELENKVVDPVQVKKSVEVRSSQSLPQEEVSQKKTQRKRAKKAQS